MNEPVRFDIWCDCERVSRSDVANYLHQLKLQPPVIAPDGNKVDGKRMQLVFFARPWRVVEAFRQFSPAWMTRVTAYQEHYGPSKADSLQHCAVHDLFYAGGIGCPVCSGNCRD